MCEAQGAELCASSVLEGLRNLPVLPQVKLSPKKYNVNVLMKRIKMKKLQLTQGRMGRSEKGNYVSYKSLDGHNGCISVWFSCRSEVTFACCCLHRQ